MNLNFNHRQVTLESFPEECPECHKTITTNYIKAHLNDNHPSAIYVFVECPNPQCNSCYSIKFNNQPYYGGLNTFRFEKIVKGTIKSATFDEHLYSISPSFIKIFSQAHIAEQQGLLEICGVGYRKALEFLIKDFLILFKLDEEERIKRMALSQCIENYVDDNKIKLAAKRAVWLGNDEAHFERFWVGKDLEDLKRLIQITTHFVVMDFLTRQIVEDMPDPKKVK